LGILLLTGKVENAVSLTLVLIEEGQPLASRTELLFAITLEDVYESASQSFLSKLPISPIP